MHNLRQLFPPSSLYMVFLSWSLLLSRNLQSFYLWLHVRYLTFLLCCVYDLLFVFPFFCSVVKRIKVNSVISHDMVGNIFFGGGDTHKPKATSKNLGILTLPPSHRNLCCCGPHNKVAAKRHLPPPCTPLFSPCSLFSGQGEEYTSHWGNCRFLDF